MLGLLFWSFILWRRLYSPAKKLQKKQEWAPLFLIAFAVIFLAFLLPMQNFYGKKFNDLSASQAPIRILFTNLYKDNFDFEGIQSRIQKENADLLLFVEFSEGHKEGLEAELEKEYPYRATTSWSKIAVWDVVFSKYPITHLADDFPQGARRYGYFRIEKEGKFYYFYLVHTSSPVSRSFFRKRNLQLQQLSKEFLELHMPQREKDAKIIMVGDLNISPWSAYYHDFTKGLSGNLENATQYFPLLFTWSLGNMLKVHQDFEFLPTWLKQSLAYLPLWSHIDHLFISPQVKLSNLKRIQFPGSDHSGFVFDIE